MTDLIGDVFVPLDATDLESGVDFPIPVKTDNSVDTFTTEFEWVDRGDEDRLEEMARQELSENELEPRVDLGYQVIRAEEDDRIKTGFVAVRHAL